VVASGSVIVDDMTEHEHAIGQNAEDELLGGGIRDWAESDLD